MVDSRSVAVGGIGFDPLSVATDGLITDQSGAIDLVQTSGIASSEAFGVSPVSVVVVLSIGVLGAEEFGTSPFTTTITASGLASSEAYGNAYGASELSSSALVSDEAFGGAATSLAVSQNGVTSVETFALANVNVVLSSEGLATSEEFGNSNAENISNIYQLTGLESVETFGLSDVDITVQNIGLESEETFGQSYASYDQVAIQFAGIESEETFGNSSIASREDIDTLVRPIHRWVARQGGSSNRSDEYQVSVSVEQIGESSSINGITTRLIDSDKIAVLAGRIVKDSPMVESVEITVDAEIVEIRNKTTIQIRGERIRKAA